MQSVCAAAAGGGGSQPYKSLCGNIRGARQEPMLSQHQYTESESCTYSPGTESVSIQVCTKQIRSYHTAGLLASAHEHITDEEGALCQVTWK